MSPNFVIEPYRTPAPSTTISHKGKSSDILVCKEKIF